MLIDHTKAPNHPKESDRPLLTEAYVRELKASLDADVKLLQELPERIESKRKRLEAAMVFVPPEFVWDLSPVVSANDGALGQASESAVSDQQVLDEELGPAPKLTWIGEVERILREAGRGLTHQEALEEVMKTDLGPQASEGAKGFYRGVAKLAERGLLVKSGGLLIHKEVADAIERSGQPLPVGPNGRIVGTSALVMKVLGEHSTGLTGPQLRDAVAQQAEATSSAREHGQYVYNIAKGLVDKGLVAKRRGVYRLRQERESAR